MNIRPIHKGCPNRQPFLFSTVKKQKDIFNIPRGAFYFYFRIFEKMNFK